MIFYWIRNLFPIFHKYDRISISSSKFFTALKFTPKPIKYILTFTIKHMSTTDMEQISINSTATNKPPRSCFFFKDNYFMAFFNNCATVSPEIPAPIIAILLIFIYILNHYKFPIVVHNYSEYHILPQLSYYEFQYVLKKWFL